MEVLVNSQHQDIDKVATTFEALNAMNKKKYNLLFYSITTKDTDEITFIKTLKQLDSDISIITIHPIIIDDSSVETHIQEEACKNGVLGIVYKPLSVDIIKYWLCVAVDVTNILVLLKAAVVEFFKRKK
ncbi:hypothetical protein AGMMS49593_10730 [Endomicrobiia bacterium]|nr:hypothetical protein AGMMS49593_10730 [Endomicrobiia bacterium]